MINDIIFSNLDKIDLYTAKIYKGNLVFEEKNNSINLSIYILCLLINHSDLSILSILFFNKISSSLIVCSISNSFRFSNICFL